MIGSVLHAFNFSPLSLSLKENAYDEYENELGITAIALYDYQAGKQSCCFYPCLCSAHISLYFSFAFHPVVSYSSIRNEDMKD